MLRRFKNYSLVLIFAVALLASPIARAACICAQTTANHAEHRCCNHHKEHANNRAHDFSKSAAHHDKAQSNVSRIEPNFCNAIAANDCDCSVKNTAPLGKIENHDSQTVEFAVLHTLQKFNSLDFSVAESTQFYTASFIYKARSGLSFKATRAPPVLFV